MIFFSCSMSVDLVNPESRLRILVSSLVCVSFADIAKTVNEEVKRLINTQKQDASVRNMADRVMKELQKQFRTEKIRRGY